MRTVIVFKDTTDTSRQVIDYLRDFQRQSGKVLEVMDPDSLEGSSFCTAYDIVEYPTIIVVNDQGQMVANWRGLPLPRIQEVSYYAN